MSTEKIILLVVVAVNVIAFLVFGFGEDHPVIEDGEAEVLDSKRKEEPV